MNFGNNRYTNEENCIPFISKCDIKKIAPPPNPKTVPTALSEIC